MFKTFQDFLIFKPIKIILECVETVVWTNMIFKPIKINLECVEFPKVRSADHLWSARFSKLVREKKRNNFIFIIYSMCSKIHPIWMKLSSKLKTPSQLQLNQCTTPPLEPPKVNLGCTHWNFSVLDGPRNYFLAYCGPLKKFPGIFGPQA